MEKTDFNQLTWFRIVAEERSFTKAAAKIGVAQSTLSYAIKQLEAGMGIRLLTRTTRNVTTTPAGERLLKTITPRMAEIEDEIAALMTFRDKPSGSIRLTLSDHALESVVWPKLKPVLREYPDIAVELILDSTFRNIVEEHFDLLVDRRAWFEPPMQNLMAFCRSDSFRTHAGQLASYDITELGQVRWNA